MMKKFLLRARVDRNSKKSKNNADGRDDKQGHDGYGYGHDNDHDDEFNDLIATTKAYVKTFYSSTVPYEIFRIGRWTVSMYAQPDNVLF